LYPINTLIFKLQKGVIIAPFLIFLFIGCQNQKITHLVFSEKSNYAAPLNRGQSIWPVWAQIQQSKDSIIVFLDQNNQTLRYWNFYNELYTDSINLRFYKTQNLEGYHVINNDSIIIALDPLYMKGCHDSAMLLVDRYRHIFQAFSFSSAPVKSRGKKLNFTTNDEVTLSQTGLMLYDKNKKAVLCRFYYNKRYQCNGFPLQYYAWNFLDSSKVFRPVPENLNCNGNGYYPAKILWSIGAIDCENNYVHGTGYNNKAIKYYPLSNKIKEVSIPVFSIDTIYQCKKPCPSGSRYPVSDFGDFSYDQFKNQYMRAGSIAPIKDNSAMQNNFSFQYLIMLDTGLHKIAEGILPFGLSAPVIAVRDGILAFNYYESEKNNKVIFTLMTYKTDTISGKQFKKQLHDLQKKLNAHSSPPIDDYLRQISANESIKNYLFVPLGASCHPCLNEFGNFLKENKNEIQNKRWGIVLITNNPTIAADFLIKYDISDLYGKCLFEDNTGIYLNYMPKWINIKRLKIGRHGRISEQKIYNPGDLPDLYKYIKDMK
jgi:hypothetical protein